MSHILLCITFAITVHQISLYGSVQSQQSLFVTYWLYICVLNASCLQKSIKTLWSSG